MPRSTLTASGRAPRLTDPPSLCLASPSSSTPYRPVSPAGRRPTPRLSVARPEGSQTTPRIRLRGVIACGAVRLGQTTTINASAAIPPLSMCHAGPETDSPDRSACTLQCVTSLIADGTCALMVHTFRDAGLWLDTSCPSKASRARPGVSCAQGDRRVLITAEPIT